MKLAVVRVRGPVNVDESVNDTLRMLHLVEKNHCVLVEDTPSNLGMIKKTKDYITYGPVESDVEKELLAKRTTPYTGRAKTEKVDHSRKYTEHEGKKILRTFRLNPPRGGYGRKGIKVSYARGGALGDRGEKINDLLKRMI